MCKLQNYTSTGAVNQRIVGEYLYKYNNNTENTQILKNILKMWKETTQDCLKLHLSSIYLILVSVSQ